MSEMHLRTCVTGHGRMALARLHWLAPCLVVVSIGVFGCGAGEKGASPLGTGDEAAIGQPVTPPPAVPSAAGVSPQLEKATRENLEVP